MHKPLAGLVIVMMSLFLSGCLTKVVTTPVKVAYKTTKYAVKGTAKVVRAVVPGGKDDDKKD